jgi:hypothetical protein
MTFSLKPKRLRNLTVASHPRDQPHLSAASGLVCAHGRVYVIADDEHHLAEFRDRRSPGRLHQVVPGDLPRDKKARKKRKPDMETLFLLPSARAGRRDALIALGSGSRANRQTGIVVGLSSRGKVAKDVRRFDLRPLYEPLRDELGGEINIEGAIVTADAFLLLNRGVAGKSANAVVHYRLRDLQHLIKGLRARIMPTVVRRYDLGAIDAIELGFTDAAALPGGGWLFTAVAEDTDDSVADGACKGSVVGVVDSRGELVGVHRLWPRMKVEGIDLQATPEALVLCLVTDADIPARPSKLLLANLKQPLGL